MQLAGPLGMGKRRPSEDPRGLAVPQPALGEAGDDLPNPWSEGGKAVLDSDQRTVMSQFRHLVSEVQCTRMIAGEPGTAGRDSFKGRLGFPEEDGVSQVPSGGVRIMRQSDVPTLENPVLLEAHPARFPLVCHCIPRRLCAC